MIDSILICKIWSMNHSWMPSLLAPDPIRVQSCVSLFWTNRIIMAVTSIFLLSHYPIRDMTPSIGSISKWKYFLLLKHSVYWPSFKGSVREKWRWYDLTAKNKRFWSLLILLLSASIKRKLLKTTYTEERSVHTNSENCNIQLNRKTQFNSKQIIQILQPIVIDYFSTHSYIIDIS